jgi:hypothetical protein
VPLKESSRKQRFIRGAACAFFLFHLAAITIGNVPRTTALGAGIHRPFGAYLRVTGLAQRWDMFSTIPHFLDIQGSLVARDERRKETRYGPLFTDPETPLTLRTQAMLVRLTYSRVEYQEALRRYLRAACRKVASRTGETPRGVGLELRTLRIRRLADIRKDQRIADEKLLRFEEGPCPR